MILVQAQILWAWTGIGIVCRNIGPLTWTNLSILFCWKFRLLTWLSLKSGSITKNWKQDMNVEKDASRMNNRKRNNSCNLTNNVSASCKVVWFSQPLYTVNNKKTHPPLFFNLLFFPYISETAWTTKNVFTSYCILF